MSYLKLKSYPKINLGLNVYPLLPNMTKHQLTSIMMLIDDYCDDIYIEEWQAPTTIEYLQDNQPITIENDSCYQLIEYLKKHQGLSKNFHIIIHKNIPFNAGLGGSSANAGVIGNYLCKQYDLLINDQDMLNIAYHIGSDIPFFMSGHSMALVSGYGEKISDLSYLHKPKVKLFPVTWNISTKEVFKEYDASTKPLTQNDYMKIIKNWNLLSDIHLSNDLLIPCSHLSSEWYETYQELVKNTSSPLYLTGSGSFLYCLVK